MPVAATPWLDFGVLGLIRVPLALRVSSLGSSGAGNGARLAQAPVRYESPLKREERREREDRKDQSEVLDRRPSFEGVDYNRSYSDTTNLRSIGEGGQHSKRPGSEPTSRGRGKN